MNKNILTYTIAVLILTACSEPTISNKAKNIHTFTYTWSNPSAQACKAHGGEVNTKGICEATLKEAKAICQSEGNALPTIEQIVSLSSECGAVSVPYKGKKSKFSSYIRAQREKNIDNQAYQQCIEAQGINMLHTYITKTTMGVYKVRTFRFRSANVSYFHDIPNSSTKYLQYITCIKGE
jgi:putative hemolysin